MFTSFRGPARRDLYFLFASLSAVLGCTKVIANEPAVEEIVISATRIEGEMNEIPASVGVLTQAQIEELAPNSLSDLLRYQPGISVEKTSDRHGDASVNIRGIGGNRVLVIKDGILMPEGFGSAGVSQGRGNFDPYSLQQVEILKGPASALYGSNALGGVMSIRTPEPAQLLDRGEGNSYVAVNTGFFSDDSRVRLGLTAATKIADDLISIQIQSQQFEETDVNSDFNPNPKEGDSQTATVKWVKTFSENNSVEVLADYYYQQAENNLLTNLVPIAGPPGTEVTEAFAEDESSVWRFGVKQALQQTGWFDQIQWQLNYQYSNYEQVEREREQTPAPPRDLIELEWEEFEQKQYGASLLLEKEARNNRLLFGIEGSQRSIVRPVNRLRTDLISQTETDVIDGISHPGKTFPDADVFQYGIFVQDHFQMSNSVKLVAGLRYDYFENEPNADQAFENFNVSNAVPETYSDDAVSPHFGLLWDLSDSMSVFANYASGFRSPPVAEQYISRAILIPVPGVPHEVIPNNELDSETSDGIEIGLRWSTDSFSASLAAYRNEYQDFIDTATVGYRDIPPVFVGPTSVRQIQHLNVDEVVIDGVELSASWLLDSLLPETWTGNLNFAASFIEGENKTSGTGLNSVPPDNAVLGLSLSPVEQWRLSWHVRGSSKAEDAEPLSQRGVTLPAFEPPGYSVHDISIRWTPAPKLNLALSVYNAGDKKYWPAHAKGNNATGNLDAIVATGRNFAFSAQYRF